MVRLGWILTEQGSAEEGIAQLHQGLAIWRAMGGELGLPSILAQLADVYGKVGRAEEGLHVLVEAMAAVHKNAERYYEAELYRLRGELLLLRDRRQQMTGNRQQLEEVEESFLQAIHIARHQHAKSLELRAVMSLSRLWQQHGMRADARQTLAELFGWFTEGFNTPDLQEAKTLLGALA